MADYYQFRVRWNPDMKEPEVTLEGEGTTGRMVISGQTVVSQIKDLEVVVRFEEDDQGKVVVSDLSYDITRDFDGWRDWRSIDEGIRVHESVSSR